MKTKKPMSREHRRALQIIHGAVQDMEASTNPLSENEQLWLDAAKKLLEKYKGDIPNNKRTGNE